MPTTPPHGPEVIQVDLATLIVCSDIQPRQGLNAATVAEYAALYQDGQDLGPIIVFQDGETRYVVDGFHRTEAAWQVGKATLPTVVHQGSLREAQLYAMGCNKHGLAYTNADKHRNVRTLLADPEWRTWSDRRIARHCGCTHPLVSKLRASLETVTSETRTYVNRYDQVATMHTGAIGKPLAALDRPPPKTWPEDDRQVRGWLTEHLKWLGYFEVLEFWWYFRETLTQGWTVREAGTLRAAFVQQGLIAETPRGQYTYIPAVGEVMPSWHRWDRWPRRHRAPEVLSIDDWGPPETQEL